MALTRGQAIATFELLGGLRSAFDVGWMARELEVDERTARRWLRDLEDRDLVVKVAPSCWRSRMHFGKRGKENEDG